LVEAWDNLNRSLEANSSYKGKLARSEADREITEARAAELERRERERAVEVAKLQKALEVVENKNSLLEAESSELQAEKMAMEADLDKTIDDTLVLLGQSFNQAIRQAHILYNGSPPSGNFHADMDVFEGWMVPCSELLTLRSAAQEALTKGVEDKDQ